MTAFEWLNNLGLSNEQSDDRPYQYDVDIRDCRDYTRWHSTVTSDLDFYSFIAWLDHQCYGTAFKVKGIDSCLTTK